MMIIPFILHGFLMVLDEVIHLKRGLGRWERWGHPIDSLSVLICFIFPQITPNSETNEAIYLSLSIFSCLLITKDEWVHHKECLAFEQWLHSLLFILHPILLYIIYYFWKQNHFPVWLIQLPYLVGFFTLYQFFYWNFLRINHDQ